MHTANVVGVNGNRDCCEATSSSAVGSVQDQAGTTWEGTDIVEWCISCLKEFLLEATTVHTPERVGTYTARGKYVESLTGDASDLFPVKRRGTAMIFTLMSSTQS